jgi:hypothetical protein
MTEYKKNDIHSSQYRRNKKRTICGILHGCSTSIKTINEWNIVWNDLLDYSNDTSNVKVYIKNYLNPQKIIDDDKIAYLEKRLTVFESGCSKTEIVYPNISVFFNTDINLYDIKEKIYGHRRAAMYIGNIMYKLSKFNKLDWINDIEIFTGIHPITHIGKHEYEVYTSYGVMEYMTLDDIEKIGNIILDKSISKTTANEFQLATDNFDPMQEDYYESIYSQPNMKTNPHYKIDELYLPKTKISNKCKIGIQKNKLKI